MNRRDFIKKAIVGSGGLLVPLSVSGQSVNPYLPQDYSRRLWLGVQQYWQEAYRTYQVTSANELYRASTELFTNCVCSDSFPKRYIADDIQHMLYRSDHYDQATPRAWQNQFDWMLKQRSLGYSHILWRNAPTVYSGELSYRYSLIRALQ